MSIIRPLISYGKYVTDLIRYGETAPNPRQLVHVDPNDIQYQLHPKIKDSEQVSKYCKHILGGDWDQSEPVDDRWFFPDQPSYNQRVALRLDRYVLYNSIRSHFVDGVPWEDTNWYDFIIRNPQISIPDYETEENMREQFARVEALYQEISESGYKPQNEVGDLSIIPEYDEITVHIGRDGEFYKAPGGKHRLIVSQILELPSVPVNVHTRHTKWQARRDGIVKSIKNGQLELDDITHPDLLSVVEGQDDRIDS